jgi:hypothetical protein
MAKWQNIVRRSGLPDVRWRSLYVGLPLFFQILPGTAAEAPAKVRGHSIALKWTEARSFQPTGDVGLSHQDNVVGKANIYVSAAGRVFSRVQQNIAATKDGRALGDRSYSSDDVSGAAKVYYWEFEDRTLVGDSVGAEGVNRISVSFGREFKN